MRYLTILLLFTSGLLSAQKITGTVRDSLGEPVFFASVVAAHPVTKTTVVFTQTDERGGFQLSVPASCQCDTVVVTARAMGYAKQSIRHALRDTGALQFALAATILQEVVIKAAAPPVVVRSDTTEYNAKSFSDSTEFSVEDLLKKIPGMQVSENGRLTLNGKEVERVLVEGDDLFNDNYTMATQNIRANAIGKIQAIDRYQENPMMKGIEQSDRLVLNLKFKEDRKRATSGSVTLGTGGNPEQVRGYAHVNLFSFTKKSKSYLIGQSNNTGNNALASIMPMSFDQVMHRNKYSLHDNPLPRTGGGAPAHFDDAGLPAAFTQQNSEGFLYFGHVLPVHERFKIKISTWGGGGQKSQKTANRTDYFTGGSPVTITETTTHRQNNGLGHIQAETEYFSKDARNGWRSFVSTNLQRYRDQHATLRPAGELATGDLVARPTVTNPLLNAFAALEYSRKTSSKSILQIVSKTGLGIQEPWLQSEFSQYPLIFNLPDRFRYLENLKEERTGYSKLTARWILQKKIENWELESGFLHQWGNSNTRTSVGDPLTEWIQPSGYQNNLRLRQYSPFVRAAYTLNWAQWMGSAQVRGTLHQMHVTNINPPDIRAVQWVTEPSASLRYTFTDRFFVMSRYNYGRQLPAWADYFSDFVFGDYLSASRGLPQFVLNESHRTNLNFFYNNKLKFFNWNAGVQWQKSTNNLGYRYRIDPYLILREGFRPVNFTTRGANATVSYFVAPASVRFEVNALLTENIVQNIVNDNARQVRNRQQMIGGSIGTAFDTWLNGITRHQYTVSRTLGDGEAAGTSNGMWRATTEFTLKQPGKQWYFKVHWYQIGNRFSNREWSFNYAVKSEFWIKLPKIHSQLTVMGMNLPGQQNYTQSYTSELFQSVSITEAVRPFVLMKWDYQF
jgi:hypothetical protein